MFSLNCIKAINYRILSLSTIRSEIYSALKFILIFISYNYFRSNTVFTIGVACYHLFIQANWTGPEIGPLFLGRLVDLYNIPGRHQN